MYIASPHVWQACVEIDVPCVFHLHCHAWSTVLLNFCWGLGSYVLCKYLYIYEVCVSSTLTQIQHDKALQCAIGVRIHSGSHDISMLIVSILLTQYSRIMSHYDFLYITRFECACALFRICNCILSPSQVEVYPQWFKLNCSCFYDIYLSN